MDFILIKRKIGSNIVGSEFCLKKKNQIYIRDNTHTQCLLLKANQCIDKHFIFLILPLQALRST